VSSTGITLKSLEETIQEFRDRFGSTYRAVAGSEINANILQIELDKHKRTSDVFGLRVETREWMPKDIAMMTGGHNPSLVIKFDGDRISEIWALKTASSLARYPQSAHPV